MARTLWSGSLSFGLVNVPVQLVTAVRDLDYHFRQLHEPDKVPIDTRRFCEEEDIEVDWDQIGHGYELDGKQVVLTDRDLAAAEPRKTRTIEIESFVPLEQIDPIYFDHPYFLVPPEGSEGTMRAYQLLVEVMGSSGRVALGRFVMRTKEYLAAIRVRGGALALTTMLFADEVRDPGDVPTGGRKPKRQELDNAVAVIEELSRDWEPERYTDCYRERLRQVIDQKREGKTIHAPKPEKQPEPVPDLMAALKESLQDIRAGNGRTRRETRATESNGKGSPLEELTVDELQERARRKKISGRSKMNKRELLAALSDDE